MGREARNEYAAKYTSERNYEMLMEIYQRTIGRADASCVDVNYGAVVKS